MCCCPQVANLQQEKQHLQCMQQTLQQQMETFQQQLQQLQRGLHTSTIVQDSASALGSAAESVAACNGMDGGLPAATKVICLQAGQHQRASTGPATGSPDVQSQGSHCTSSAVAGTALGVHLQQAGDILCGHGTRKACTLRRAHSMQASSTAAKRQLQHSLSSPAGTADRPDAAAELTHCIAAIAAGVEERRALADQAKMLLGKVSKGHLQ